MTVSRTRLERMLPKALLKEAADLGMRNIPMAILVQVAPGELQALYWREPAEAEKTIEIWSTSNGTFIVFDGNYVDREWGAQDIEVVGEFNDIQSALSFAESNYTLLGNEEPVEQAAFKKSRLRKLAMV